ncbi:sn-glycerol-3-phosphate ABC transporter ATP-binding protein UgpC [Uliginosibacterium sp. H3]|uniref:Sn-glycerol-3-phosphate ABC transporter ATP-binding protein UgpC n=1 Tax=Uliginosibacterium silvisoli TaxID=3114758 RepID=A0ABU6K425_9RHOO|nr:sn-glycerol-3-phosphate ABC transporter ATP-binding protein UgpC [Uliginosibacterium sp. H3]
MGALSIRKVRKSYAGVEILKGIDIDIEQGEFLILVGPSGCGKSTLLSMIAGLDEITSGDVFIADRRVNDLSPKDRDIAMVFQSYALYPSMTVRENISFGLEIRKMPKAERDAAVDRVAQILQIEHLLDRRPSQLSGGQRQRVAMGRAIARNPALFLFDEPLSNLDAKLRVEMRTEIKLLHKRLGTTIVYVTHDQIEAMTLGDKIAVMKAGEVQQFGTPSDIYRNPANLFVAGFMGSPSMNFIKAKVCESGSGLGLEMESGGERFAFPAVNGEGLAAWKGREVIVGIRPEQITEVVDSHGDDPRVVRQSLPIVLSEPTGPDTLLLVHINGAKVTCRVCPDFAGVPGEKMALMFDLSKVVYFDPSTEQRIK